MSRNAFVPMAWITSDLNGEALRTLILISTYADASTGKCWPSNSELAKVCRKTERAIRNDIHSLVESGMISIVDFNGRRRVIRIESPEWFDRRTQNHRERAEEKLPVCPEEKLPSRVEEKLPVCPEEKRHPLIRTHPINTPNEHGSSSGGFSEESKPPETATTTTTRNLEPFESGNPSELPNVRNAVEPFRPRLVELKPTEFKPETRDRMMTVLGIDAEQFARKVTQEQADAGFVDWIMGECKRNKTPGRLAFHLLKTAWREGWIDPKAEEEAKRAARRKRLEALR